MFQEIDCLLRVVFEPGVPPQGGGGKLGLPMEVRSHSVTEKGSRKGVYVGTPKPAFDSLWAGRALMWVSVRVRIRKDTRPAEAGHVGSCSSNPISIQGYGGYPGGGGVVS